MKPAFIITILFLAMQPLMATRQIPDVITIDGKDFSTDKFFMEAYFKKHPEKRKNLHNDLKDSKGRLLQVVLSSALWRGYYAHYEIKKNFLVLKDIEVPVSGENLESRMSALKNMKLKDKVLKITWYSGKLLLHNEQSADEKRVYYLITFEKGKMIDKKKFNFKEYQTFIGEKN